MIEVIDNIAKLEGSAKEICTNFTHLLVTLINTFEREFDLSREESQKVITKCIEIAYMNDDERAKFLSEFNKEV